MRNPLVYKGFENGDSVFIFMKQKLWIMWIIWWIKVDVAINLNLINKKWPQGPFF